MAKYLLSGTATTVVTYTDVEIDADSEDEAKQTAEEMATDGTLTADDSASTEYTFTASLISEDEEDGDADEATA
jgi:hypothetical protein